MSRSRLILLSICFALAVGAGASAPAWAGPLHYYNQQGVKLAEKIPLLIDATGSTQVLKAVAGGLAIEINCSALDSHGKVENPTGGGAGTTLTALLYLGCVVTPATLECMIPQLMFSFSVNGVLQGTNAVPDILFTPDPSGAAFFKLKFEGCKNVGLNTEFPFEGSLLGKIANSTSIIKIEEFKGNSSMFKFGGNEAGLAGTEAVEMTGGGKLEVKE